MDSHSRSASPRDAPRPQHRPPSPPPDPNDTNGAAFANLAFQHDEDPNHNESLTSNGPTQNGHSKEPNGDTKALEAVNLELINMAPKNGSSKKKDVEVDMSSSNPYDEYFVPVNEHKKYMRGEKLYVTADKRSSEKAGCKRPLCWTLVALVAAVAIALIILAATGVLFTSTPTPVEPYNASISSARAFGGIPLTNSEESQDENTNHEEHTSQEGHTNTQEETSDEYNHDHSAHANHTDDGDHKEHNHVTEEPIPLFKDVQNEQPDNSEFDYSLYVPRTLEGELTIDNEEFRPSLEDPESEEYKEFTKNFSDGLKKALFDRNTLANGDHEITVEVVNLRKGSIIVTYRINWRPKYQDQVSEKDQFITSNSVDSSLSNYLERNNRMIDIYHVAETKTTPRPVLDLCQNNKNGCEHKCEFDSSSLEFTCVCPEGLMVDSKNSKKCIPLFITPEQRFKHYGKEINILETNSTTIKPVYDANTKRSDEVQKEQKLNDSLAITSTESDLDINFRQIINYDNEEVAPEPTAEPKPEPIAEPKPDTSKIKTKTEPRSELRPETPTVPVNKYVPLVEIYAVDSKPQPQSTTEPLIDMESMAEPESTAEPRPEPTAEPKPEFTAEPKPEPTDEPKPEPTAEIKSQTISEPKPEPEPTTEPELEPEPMAEPKLEPEPTAEPTSEPQPAAEPKPEPEPTAEPTSEPQPAAEPKPELEHTAEPTSEPQPVAEPKPEPEPTAEAEPIPESKLISMPQPEQELTSESVLMTVVEPVPETIHQSEFIPELLVEPKTNSQSTTESYSVDEKDKTIHDNLSVKSLKAVSSSSEEHKNRSIVAPESAEDDDIIKMLRKLESQTQMTLEDSEPTTTTPESKEERNIWHETKIPVYTTTDRVSLSEFSAFKSKPEIIASLNQDTYENKSDTSTADFSTSNQLHTFDPIPRSFGFDDQQDVDATTATSKTASLIEMTLQEQIIKKNSDIENENHSQNIFYNDNLGFAENDNGNEVASTTTISSLLAEINKSLLRNENNAETILHDSTTESKLVFTLKDEPTTIIPERQTQYSLSNQYHVLGDDIDLMKALNKKKEKQKKVETTTEEDVIGESRELTFDAINKLNNHSAKTVKKQNDEHHEFVTEISEENYTTTTESDWLDVDVTETNLSKTMKTVEEPLTTEIPLSKVEEMISHGIQNDFEPEYMTGVKNYSKSDLNDQLYGMINDYENEDTRIKRVHAAINDMEIVSKMPIDEETTLISTTDLVMASEDSVELATPSLKSRYDSLSSETNILPVTTLSPAPVWEEAEGKNDIRNKEITIPSLGNTLVVDNTSSSKLSSEIEKQNNKQGNRFNVTIYEVPKNASLNSQKSGVQSAEYEDHETEMNPFLPEIENNKSLVKKLQEGQDLEPVNLNETQNENLDDHTIHTQNNSFTRSSGEDRLLVNDILKNVGYDEAKSNSTNPNKFKDVTTSELTSQFLIDTEDLDATKDETTETTAKFYTTTLGSKNVSELNDNSDYLSVMPILEKVSVEKPNKVHKSEKSHQSEESDLLKKSDKRTKIESVLSNEA